MKTFEEGDRNLGFVTLVCNANKFKYFCSQVALLSFQYKQELIWQNTSSIFKVGCLCPHAWSRFIKVSAVLVLVCNTVQLKNTALTRCDTQYFLKHKIYWQHLKTPHLWARAVWRIWAAGPCRSSARGVWDLGCRRHGSGGWQIRRAPGPASLDRPRSLEGLDAQTQTKPKTQTGREKRGEWNIITHCFMVGRNSWGNVAQTPTHAVGREEFVSPQHGIYSHITRIQELWGCFITARVLHEIDVGHIYHLPHPPGRTPQMNVEESRGKMKYEVIVYMNR